MNHDYEYPSSMYCQDVQGYWWGPPDSYYEPPRERLRPGCPWCGTEQDEDTGLCPSCDDPKGEDF